MEKFTLSECRERVDQGETASIHFVIGMVSGTVLVFAKFGFYWSYCICTNRATPIIDASNSWGYILSQLNFPIDLAGEWILQSRPLPPLPFEEDLAL